MPIHTEGRWFKDQAGRTLFLRGVNLGGSSKVPRTPDGATWRRDGLRDHRQASFVGRPFPLEQAEEHFSRLRRWGLTTLRFLVTWEAIEHAGPRIYDEAYLDYLAEVVRLAGEYDLQVFIDPHQDVWSRFTGGDGAPGWTLEAVGMDLARIAATGAAITQQEHGDPFPRMIWPSNYGRFACATMWTLFFGGNRFAPETRVEGVPVQDYLQGHYIDAVKQVTQRLRGMDHVIGYDTLNEPSPGYIGLANCDERAGGLAAMGPSPTIWQGMLLAAGYPQEVEVRDRNPFRLGRAKRQLLNPEGVSLWRDGCEPIWQQNGVWDLDRAGQPRLLRPGHFGQGVHFDREHFQSFVTRFCAEIRTADPGTLVFVDPVPGALMPPGPRDYGLDGVEGLVNAAHWYDGLTLHLQRYLPWLGLDIEGGRIRLALGRKGRRRSFAQQIGRHVVASDTMFGGAPILIGETGIPFNMHRQEAYHSGDFGRQVRAMDDTLQAMDANLVSYTLWNYTADNDNEHGDQWNDEDLSIYSADQRTGTGGLDDGGRALEAVVRPYARAVPGEPVSMIFDITTRVFEFEFTLDPGVRAPAEFFVPEHQYPQGYRVEAPGGTWEARAAEQLVVYVPDDGRQVHRVRIVPREL